MEQDLDAFVQLLKNGYTVYTTPEGRFSRDGRLNRFRSSLAPMCAATESIVVAGVSYDILRPGKLAMWVQFESPRWPDRWEDSVAAARPVTAGHLVVAAWRGRPHVRPADVVADALHLLDQIRNRAVVTSDLRTHPERSLSRALTEFGRRMANGGPITDERFPFVEDFAAYYEAQWSEITRVLAATDRQASVPQLVYHL